jgi:hypothetical protein
MRDYDMQKPLKDTVKDIFDSNAHVFAWGGYLKFSRYSG